ncbi:MAG: hypothetical protein ABI374_02945 [Ginsengibacter sp.]
MKNILLLFFLFFTNHTIAQVNSIMPAQANTFYENAMSSIKPDIKNLIEKNANKLRGRKVDVDSLVNALHKSELLRRGTENDLESITVLILVQASKYADADLKILVINLTHSKSKQNDETEKEISKNKTELILSNKSDIAQSVSFIMKKISGSPEMVVDKFK